MSTNSNNQSYLPILVTSNPNELKTSIMLPSTTTTPAIYRTNSLKRPERDNWSNRIVYLLSIIGFVVDLGKIFFSN